jgi:hypothetical protein
MAYGPGAWKEGCGLRPLFLNARSVQLLLLFFSSSLLSFNGGYFVEWECVADLSADTLEAKMENA